MLTRPLPGTGVVAESPTITMYAPSAVIRGRAARRTAMWVLARPVKAFRQSNSLISHSGLPAHQPPIGATTSSTPPSRSSIAAASSSAPANDV